jgi:hypothetical protein
VSFLVEAARPTDALLSLYTRVMSLFCRLIVSEETRLVFFEKDSETVTLSLLGALYGLM